MRNKAKLAQVHVCREVYMAVCVCTHRNSWQAVKRARFLWMTKNLLFYYFYLFINIFFSQHHWFIRHLSHRVWIVSSSHQFGCILCSAFAHRSQQRRQQQHVQCDDMQITRMHTNLQISTATLTTTLPYPLSIHFELAKFCAELPLTTAAYHHAVGSESFARLSGRCN